VFPWMGGGVGWGGGVGEADRRRGCWRQLWVAYVAPPLPPSAVRGLLLLLASLAGQLQRGSRVGAGRRCRAAGWLVVGVCRNVPSVGLAGFGVTAHTFGSLVRRYLPAMSGLDVEGVTQKQGQ
jgi:hypothetical protein